jgi:hypothetical protein
MGWRPDQAARDYGKRKVAWNPCLRTTNRDHVEFGGDSMDCRRVCYSMPDSKDWVSRVGAVLSGTRESVYPKRKFHTEYSSG